MVGAVTVSQAGVRVNVSFGIPFPQPVVIRHSVPVYAPPVVVAPPFCAPPRVVVACPPPPRYRHGYRHDRGYGRDHYRHHGYDRRGHGHRH